MITDAQRRARLAVRHGIAPAYRLGSVTEVAEAMVALHATEAATVHLSIVARSDCSLAEVEAALYAERSLVKQLAMRRTLFAFPRDLLPAVWGSASARTAEQQRRQLAKEAERAGLATDGEQWVDAACAAVRQRLADGSALTATQLREQVPELTGQISFGEGASYAGTIHIAPRVLTLIGAQGHIMRAENVGHWRTSRPRWTATTTWLGGPPEMIPGRDGYAVLVKGWLEAFGPGTERDIAWWLGGTKAAVRQALEDVDALPVALEDGACGWVLAEEGDEVALVAEPEPWAALLPVLDPTAMGYKDRDFYFDPLLVPLLMDINGNIGATAWWCGRIVGTWVQDEGGVVRLVTRPGVSGEAVEALTAEADRLTRWLDGVVVSSVYKSPAMKGAPLPPLNKENG